MDINNETKLDCIQEVMNQYRTLVKDDEGAEPGELSKQAHDSLIHVTQMVQAEDTLAIVKVFIGMSWDLEAFVDWVKERITDKDDAIALIGLGTVLSEEWDT